MQKKSGEKPKAAVREESRTAPTDALLPEPEPAAPKKQYRCVGVDASTGTAVMEEVEEG